MRILLGRPIGGALATVAGCLVVACASAPPAPRNPAGSRTRLLLEDDFDDYRPQWRQVRGQWAVANGQVLQARDDAREQNTIMFYDPLSVADAEMSTVVRMIARLPQFPTADDRELIETRRLFAGAGVVFRYQNENNFYMFRLAGEEGAVLGKMVEAQWRDLVNPRAADFSGTRIQVDTDYTLRVRMEGRRL
jgi:hypothetical protein